MDIPGGAPRTNPSAELSRPETFQYPSAHVVFASYAFYTVFSPKTETALSASADVPTAIYSTLDDAIAQLELEQNEYLAKLNRASEERVASCEVELSERIDTVQTLLDGTSTYFEQRHLEVNAQRRQLKLEAEGKTGSGIAHDGGLHRAAPSGLRSPGRHLPAEIAQLHRFKVMSSPTARPITGQFRPKSTLSPRDKSV